VGVQSILLVIKGMIIAWQAQSSNPDNATNFGIIANWWKALDSKSMLWKQRLIPEKGEVDWSPQRFDETIVFTKPEVRGLTFYWKAKDAEAEKNITPSKLEFNPTKQRLLLYPETQKDVMISVEIPGAIRESLQMKNPTWFSEQISNDVKQVTGYRLIIHDTTNLVEVEIEMDKGSLDYLKHALNKLS
jgi:hypothetical protein